MDYFILSHIFLLIFSLVIKEVLLDQSPILSDLETLIKTLKSKEQDADLFSKSHGERFEVEMIEKLAEFEIQMIYHFNHSFEKSKENVKWTKCLSERQQKINAIKEKYNNNSIYCGRQALGRIKESQLGVTSLVKQIRGWQGGYRYLKKICQEENTDLTKKEMCLIEYLTKDAYDETLHKLLQYLEKSQQSLETNSRIFIKQLDDCLRDVFSTTITQIRKLMIALNKCYNDDAKSIDNTIGEGNTSVGELKRQPCDKNP